MKKVYMIFGATIVVIVLCMIYVYSWKNKPTQNRFNDFKKLPSDMKTVDDERTEEEEVLYDQAKQMGKDVKICFADFNGDGQNEALAYVQSRIGNVPAAAVNVLGLDAQGEVQSLFSQTVEVDGGSYNERSALYICRAEDGGWSLLLDRSCRSSRVLNYQQIGFELKDGNYKRVILNRASEQTANGQPEQKQLERLMKNAVRVVDSRPEDRIE